MDKTYFIELLENMLQLGDNNAHSPGKDSQLIGMEML